MEEGNEVIKRFDDFFSSFCESRQSDKFNKILICEHGINY